MSKPSDFTYEDFVSKNAMSRRDQPALGQLIDALRQDSEPITLIVGAGLSIDAGLPSWSELVDRIAEGLGDSQLSQVAKADRGDPGRKAEFLFDMAAQQYDTKSTTVRKALYGSNQAAPTGALSDAVARLIAVLGERVTVMTTNFDDVLETSLQEYFDPATVTACGHLESVSDDHDVTVIHLHGLLAAGRVEEDPNLVLSESSFLTRGGEVKRQIAQQLRESTCVFIGVSLSDPNLVWPLWEREQDNAEDKRPAFVLTVPDGVDQPGDATDDHDWWQACLRYRISAAAVLRRRLGITPIFLKSYSQQTQLIYEMALAARWPDNYVDGTDGEQDAFPYGYRFQTAIDAAYEGAGCSEGAFVPVGPQADALCARLALAIDGEEGVLSTLALIRDAVSALPARRDGLGQLGLDERFGVYLWLRVPRRRSSAAPYALNLIGSTIQAPKVDWASRTEVEISPIARHAAASALYSGRLTQVEFDIYDRYPWSALVAVPLIAEGLFCVDQLKGRALDSLYLGAVTLNTTHPIQPDERPTMAEVRWPNAGPSFLSILTPDELARVMRCVHTAALRAIGLTP